MFRRRKRSSRSIQARLSMRTIEEMASHPDQQDSDSCFAIWLNWGACSGLRILYNPPFQKQVLFQGQYLCWYR